MPERASNRQPPSSTVSIIPEDTKKGQVGRYDRLLTEVKECMLFVQVGREKEHLEVAVGETTDASPPYPIAVFTR